MNTCEQCTDMNIKANISSLICTASTDLDKCGIEQGTHLDQAWVEPPKNFAFLFGDPNRFGFQWRELLHQRLAQCRTKNHMQTVTEINCTRQCVEQASFTPATLCVCPAYLPACLPAACPALPCPPPAVPGPGGPSLSQEKPSVV